MERTSILARTVLAGLMAAALATPRAASAAGTVKTAIVNTIHPIFSMPEDIIHNKADDLGAAFTGPIVGRGTADAVPGGYRIFYQNCDIYYSGTTGVHEVHGGIRLKYNYVGGPWSSLGLPTSDETSFGDGVGRFNVFANNNSAIVWHPTTGPMVIQGAIHAAWVNQGSGQGPLGYPTSDEIALGNGAAYSDFQNGVLYWNGSQLVTPPTAGLTGAQMAKSIRGFLGKRYNRGNEIDHCSLLGETGTGYDFLRSRSRWDTFFLDGEWLSGIQDDFALRMQLTFAATKESDGSTSLRVAPVDYNIVTTPDLIESFGVSADAIRRHVQSYFVPSDAPKLIDLSIPSVVNVLSFKVLADGGIQLYLEPGAVAPLVVLAVQFQWDDLAR